MSSIGPKPTLARHYGTAIVPARPYKQRDKAKVEVGVQVVRRWILARLRHRRFFSLAELNAAIRAQLDELNDRPMRGWSSEPSQDLPSDDWVGTTTQSSQTGAASRQVHSPLAQAGSFNAQQVLSVPVIPAAAARVEQRPFPRRNWLPRCAGMDWLGTSQFIGAAGT
jgi:hypothetical protein